MKIGSFEPTDRAFLAPMAGVADGPFRRIVKSFGASLVYSEMISSEGLIREAKKTKNLLSFTANEYPIGIQLFGASPESLQKCVDAILLLNPSIIDLNAACPKPKITQNHSGVALMQNLPLLKSILTAMVAAAGQTPVTVKFRLGWDANSINYIEAINIAMEAGVAAIGIHARTRTQGYSGKASWHKLAYARKICSIPLIGSGDIWTPDDALHMVEQTGVDAVFVARGALGKPWQVARIAAALDGRPIPYEPPLSEKATIAITQLDDNISTYGVYQGIRRMRKHLIWFTHGWKDVRGLREKIIHANTREAILKIFMDYFLSLADTKGVQELAACL